VAPPEAAMAVVMISIRIGEFMVVAMQVNKLPIY
jgi:hypothetical protein